VHRSTYGLKAIFMTTRGRISFLANVLVAFGLVSAIVQFLGQFFPNLLPSAGTVTAVSVLLCLAWGVFRAYPRRTIRRQFKHPEMSVVVEVGDVFDQVDAHLVVGFTDTFDTLVTGDHVIHRTSVQGQLLARWFEGDQEALDLEVAGALSAVTPVGRETPETKPDGKLTRYPIGTVAVLGTPQRRLFAVAYGRMGNDLIVRSTLDDIWHSLNNLWESIYLNAHREAVAMPLIGSGLARINHLERESLLKLIVMSFVANSRQRLICHELRLIVWPPDLDRVNLIEVEAFIRNL
jgi:hypothetical protein